MAAPTARANDLPADEPLAFSAGAADAAAMPLAAPYAFDAAAPRPGQKPNIAQTLPIVINPTLVFPSAWATAQAGIENPAGSGVSLRYRIVIAGDELRRVAGLDAAQDEVCVAQTGLIAPGYGLDTLWLDPLADGGLLPQGQYEATAILESFDAATNQTTNADFCVNVSLRVLADERALDADADGYADWRAHNAAGEAASHRLVISRQALFEALGDSAVLDDGSAEAGYNPEYSYVTLYQGASVEAYGTDETRARLLFDGAPLPAGRYETWLVRDRASAASEVVGRVWLSIQNAEVP